MLEKFKEKMYSLSSSTKFMFFSIFIIILIIILLIYNNKKVEDTFIDELSKLGYHNTDGGNYYYKNIGGITLNDFNAYVSDKVNSKYEMNYFDVDEVLFKKNKRVYYDGMLSNLNMFYDYKEKVVTYNYRVEDVGEATLIYSGNYEFKNKDFVFTCEKEYIYKYDLESSNELVCDNIKYDVRDFYDEAVNIISNYSLLNRLIK